jgi:hypothetical protein
MRINHDPRSAMPQRPFTLVFTLSLLAFSIGFVFCEPPEETEYVKQFHERFGEPAAAPPVFDQDLFNELYMGERLTSVFERGIDNEQGSLAWGLSYMMSAYNEMYRYSGDTKYLDAMLACARHALKVRDDKTGRELWTGEVAPIWGAGKYAERGRAAFAVHTGMIVFPIMEFIALAERSAFFSEVNAIELELLAAAMEQSVAYHDRQWREGPADGEGHYVGLNQENILEGKPLPGNRLSAMGLALWFSSEATGNDVHRQRAIKIGCYIKNRLTLREDGSYFWEYWLPESAAPKKFDGQMGEDISHGALTAALPSVLGEAGLVFDAQAMRQFAATVTKGFARRDDGILFGDISGNPKSSPKLVQIPARWLPIAASDPTARKNVLTFYARYQTRPGALDLALLIRYRPQ